MASPSPRRGCPHKRKPLRGETSKNPLRGHFSSANLGEAIPPLAYPLGPSLTLYMCSHLRALVTAGEETERNFHLRTGQGVMTRDHAPICLGPCALQAPAFRAHCHVHPVLGVGRAGAPAAQLTPPSAADEVPSPRVRGKYGVWSMEYGVRSMEYGVWSMEYGVWSTEYGVWSTHCCHCYSGFTIIIH